MKVNEDQLIRDILLMYMDLIYDPATQMLNLDEKVERIKKAVFKTKETKPPQQ